MRSRVGYTEVEAYPLKRESWYGLMTPCPELVGILVVLVLVLVVVVVVAPKVGQLLLHI